MADEAKETAQGGKKGGGIVKLAIFGVLLLAAAGGGFATYTFLIAPKLMPAEAAPTVEESAEFVPANPVMLDFEDNFVNVIMEDPNIPASTLMYSVTFECINQMTADLVSLHMAKFIDLIAKMHDSRMRSELDDIKSLKESIQQELRQQANALLQTLRQPEMTDDLRITNVYHRSMLVADNL